MSSNANVSRRSLVKSAAAATLACMAPALLPAPQASADESYPYMMDEYLADKGGAAGSMYVNDWGWVEEGQTWELCRVTRGPKVSEEDASYEHAAYVTVDRVATYGTYQVNGYETYAHACFTTYAGNTVEVSFSMVGSSLRESYMYRNQIRSLDDCYLSHNGYQVVYRPTDKSNWFVPVLGAWI